MNISKGMQGSLTLLALLVSGHALAANSERPKLKDYDSYTDFMRAVVSYTKSDGQLEVGERECRDGKVGGESQQNSCNASESLRDSDNTAQADGTARSNEAGIGSNTDISNTGPTTDDMDNASITDLPYSDPNVPNALEQAIAQARDGLNPHYVDNSGMRTTFNSFPMQPVDPNDLAQVSLVDALSGLLVTERDAKIRLNIDSSKLTDPLALTDARLTSDSLALDLDSIEAQQQLLNNILPFAGGNFIWSVDGGNYYSNVYVQSAYIGDRGVSLALSTEASVRAAIVDSDGWSRAAGNQFSPSAGAMVIDPLNIKTDTIVAKLFALDDGAGNTSILASLESLGDITINLSDTNIGVASATRSGNTWELGSASNFLSFGPNSILTIRLDEPMETIFSNPDNDTPLLRINGSIPQLTLSDVALVDSSSKQGIHFGRVTVRNLKMVDTSVYFENDAIRVDMGKGTSNLRMDIERIVLGGTMLDRANGSLPPALGDTELYVATPDNMQITLRAH